MKRKEFKKLEVGDKVLIKNDNYRWWVPDMDCFDNQVVEIHKVYTGGDFLIKGSGFVFNYTCIIKKVEEETIVIKSNGLTVTAYKGKEKAVAKCSPKDKFDLYTGAKLALDRLFGKEEKTEEKPKFEVGDIVVAITENYACTTRSNKWVGQVIKVNKNNFSAETISGVGSEKSTIYGLLCFEDFKKLDKTDYEKLF